MLQSIRQSSINQILSFLVIFCVRLDPTCCDLYQIFKLLSSHDHLLSEVDQLRLLIEANRVDHEAVYIFWRLLSLFKIN